jgi:Tol biopolymer transport system component
MGEVWLARDLRLERKVAVKVLPAHLTTDEARVARFRQEARAASALNHPNVCTIYTLGEADDGRVFIAMEYIEGSTLRQRLAAGALSIREALDVTAQIASALASAHAAGVIHRDVKPENVMIRSDGVVKVLDFGLAKLDPTVAIFEPAQSTRTGLRTDDGTVMGTIAYMSPEQASAQPLDVRADLFSLGAVLYEMVTARQAFAGKSTAIIHDAILNRTPASPLRLNPDVPLHLEDIINKALEKDRELRYQSASELRADLLRLKRDTDAHATGARGVGRDPVSGAPHRRIPRAAVVSGLVLGAALTALAIGWGRLPFLASRSDLQEVQLTTNSAEDPVTAAAISPDGKYIAYADRAGVHLRLIDSGETNTIRGPDFGSINSVAWFADGSKLVVSAAGAPVAATPGIWVVPLIGGVPRKIRDDGIEASVSPDDSQIAFVAANRRSLWAMSANGDEVHQLLAVGPDEQLHLPRFWRNATNLAFGHVRIIPAAAGGLTADVSIELQDPNGHVIVLFSDPGLRGLVQLPDGRQIYSLVAEPALDRGTTLWQTETDFQTGLRRGKPRRISRVVSNGAFVQFTTSADGKRIAFLKTNPQQDVYVGDMAADGSPLNARRFTLDDRNDFVTNWTADGHAILFTSDRNGTYDIFKQALDQRTPEPVISGPDDEMGPTAVSPDGAWFYYQVQPKGWRFTVLRRLRTMRTPAAGGPTERVVDEPGLQTALCSRPPSTVCVLVKTEGKQLVIYALEPREGAGRKITSADVGASPFYPPSISPDGSRVAILMPAEQRIRIVSLLGEAPRDVALEGWSVDPSYFHWTADGRGWYVSSTSTALAGGTDILRVDLNGQVNAVWHQAFAMATSAIPSPDGRHLAFTNATTISNVWLLKGF